MLKKLLATLRGYRTLKAIAASYNRRDGELALLTDDSVAPGQKVLVQFPNGKRVPGRASWERRSSNAREQGHLVGVPLSFGGRHDEPALDLQQERP